jgi:penicillin-binding protein 2A
MDTALTNSWNVTAVWLLDQIGINYGKKFAERQGLKVFTDADKYLPIAIGGISKGVSPLDMANAYQGFATGGLKTDAHIIRRIVAHNGDIIHEADTELKRTMKEKTADYMRYMMRHVVLNGTGRNANVSPDDMISGKTGTTEVPWKGSSNNKDIWFVGYTKDYVGAIWMGFDNTDKKHSMPEYSGVPAKMFGEIIKPLLKEKPDPVSNYNEPTPVKSDINEFKASGELIDNTKQVKLKWGTDEEDVYYKVYRDGEEIAKTESGSYTDTGTEDGKSYSYKVMAFKNDSNIPILESNIISIKIPGKKDEEKPKENPTDTPNTSPDTPVTTEPTQTEPTDTNNTPVEPPADPATTTQPEQTDQTTVNQQAVTQPQAPETTPTDTTTTTNGN